MSRSAISRPIDRVAQKIWVGRTLARAGVIRPTRPDRLARIGLAYRRWGVSPALGYVVGAIRRPDGIAIIDELGQLTFAEMNRRTNALAAALREQGISEGDGVAILCRNHRGFIDATIACAKIGATALYLNTQFAAAFVVRQDQQSLSDDDVRSYVKDNLARYKVPREVRFVDELPRNATGKVVKRELAQQFEREADSPG